MLSLDPEYFYHPPCQVFFPPFAYQFPWLIYFHLYCGFSENHSDICFMYPPVQSFIHSENTEHDCSEPGATRVSAFLRFCRQPWAERPAHSRFLVNKKQTWGSWWSSTEDVEMGNKSGRRYWSWTIPSSPLPSGPHLSCSSAGLACSSGPHCCYHGSQAKSHPPQHPTH